MSPEEKQILRAARALKRANILAQKQPASTEKPKTVTLTPSNASKGMPRKSKGDLAKTFAPESKAFDPHEEKKPDFFKVDIIPFIAQKLLESAALDIVGVNKIYQSAIGLGLTSKQAIFESLGREILDDLDSTKVNPDPESARRFLNFVLTCDPKEATGRPIPWVHAKKRTKEAPEAPSL